MPYRHAVKNGKEIFALMRRLRSLPDEEYLQSLIVYHAAPTLQGIKPASLVCPGCEGRDIEGSLALIGANLEREFGVRLEALERRSFALPLLVYVPHSLGKTVYAGEAGLLLREKGYDLAGNDLAGAIKSLKERFACNPFPHEIGVFLGYPARDVREFMRDDGRGSACTGCWRAYGDREIAETTFARFRRAKQLAAELMTSGANLAELAEGLRLGA